MRGHITTFWAPKLGNSAKDYEDAAFPGPASDGDTGRVPRLRIVVADGATEAFLSSRWAATLVRKFGATTDRCFASLSQQAREEWAAVVERYLAERQGSGRPLAWFEENRIPEGSAATILAADFMDSRRSSEPGRWWALAVGDACMFQVRGDKLVASYPLDSSAGFGATPQLVSSRADLGVRGERPRERHGTFQSDDLFLLCTDAAACWILKTLEAGESPWGVIRDWPSQKDDGFENWLAAERSASRMRNDDVTIVRLEIF